MREEPSNGVVVTVTTSSIISNRNCIVTGVGLNPSAAACTISLYDPPPFVTLQSGPGTAAGTPTTVGATLRITMSGAAAASSISTPYTSGVEFANGCIAVVTGVGATANIAWAVI